MLGGDEYRLFQEIASNSMSHKKPPLLPNGKAGSFGANGSGDVGAGGRGNALTRAKTPPPSASAAPAPSARAAAVRAIPQLSLPVDSSSRVPAAAADNAGTPPAPCYVPSTPRGDGGKDSRSNAKRRPILAHSSSAPVPASSDSSLGTASVWSPIPSGGGGDRREDGEPSGGGEGSGSGSAKKKQSIWDQPEKPTRQQRGPKYYTARRSRPPAGPLSSGRSSISDSGRQLSMDSLSPDGLDSDYDSDTRASGEIKPGGIRGVGVGVGTSAVANGGGDTKQKTREIKKRMWGKRPSWTGALIEPSAGAATAGAAAASVPGASAREAAGAAAAPRTESGLNHLIVLVHGLGGRPADMAFMRSYLQTLMPGAEASKKLFYL